MGKQSKNELLGKVYREFSRQKYNKYKAQFPKLRESDIVTKIIKEWDALDNKAKENLQKIYEEKKFLTNEDISSSEALKKARHSNIASLVAAQRSAKKQTTPASFSATKFHSNIKQVERDGSDFNRGSEAKDDSRLAESSSPAVFIKTKQIAKPSQSDYITFFKTYYRNLGKEHPRWTTQQISSVIKLLWKKRKNQGKSLKKNGRLRTSKPLSGRRYFRKVKNLDGIEARIRWRLLPREGKIYWNNESQGIQTDKRNQTGKVHFKSNSIKAQSANKFGFLSKAVS